MWNLILKKRNLLCIKHKINIDLGEKLLYNPYKNILKNFRALATNSFAKEFDPIYRIYSGLESVDDDIKFYYESLLGVTSYFQSSKGGRGKYIEKKLSSMYKTCGINIKFSELPILLEFPEIIRKKGLFTLKSLNHEELKTLRKRNFNFLGRVDETTDIGNLLRANECLNLLELKNRVDSGGTSARREIWSKKFNTIFEYLSSSEVLFKKGSLELNLIQLLKKFQIKNLNIYIGILFNVEGTPATKEGDKGKGFYSSNEEGYKDLKNFIVQKGFTLIEDNIDQLELSLEINELRIKFGALYGNQIPTIIFNDNFSVSNLLKLKYDDIWFSQLLTINERTILLEFGKNSMLEIIEIIENDLYLKTQYNLFKSKEGDLSILNVIVDNLCENYSENFPDYYFLRNGEKKQYLADILQFLAAVEF